MIWLLIITIICLATLLIILARFRNKNNNLGMNLLNNDIKFKNLTKEIDRQTDLIKYLTKIKNADENIFDLIRCINMPKIPVCKNLGSDPRSNVCRSRFIDCNNFKLIVQKDPVAVYRMKKFTDKYDQIDHQPNPSDLTYDIKSSWHF